MSYDLMVFEAQKAPKRKKEFLAWFNQKSDWEEERDYNSLEGSEESLKTWFFQMKEQFPQMNGDYALTDEEFDKLEEREVYVTDYCIGSDLIYAAFGWSVSEEAYYWVRKEAMRSGLGFFDISGSGEIILPNGNLMEGCVAVFDDAARHKNSLENPSLAPHPKDNHLSHLAIFLRFLWEEKQMAQPLLLEKYKHSHKEYREFIGEDLQGKITSKLFAEEGNLFALNYYSTHLTQFAQEHGYYPELVDEVAQEICGEQYQGDAYLFAPYDEARYQKMKERLEEKYEAFRQFWANQK